MPYSDTVKQIISEKRYDIRFPNVRGPIHRLLSFIDEFAKVCAAIKSNPRINEYGKQLDLKAAAEKAAVEFGQLQREVQHEQTKLEKAKADLAPKFPTVSEPMMLALADRLSKMNGAERAKLLADGNADPRLLATLFNAPSILHGVDAGLVDAIKNKIVAETKPAELAHLTDKADALALADGAVRVAREALIGASDLPPASPAAEKWLASLTTPQSRSFAVMSGRNFRFATLSQMCSPATKTTGCWQNNSASWLQGSYGRTAGPGLSWRTRPLMACARAANGNQPKTKK
jgi:hypothetical protein